MTTMCHNDICPLRKKCYRYSSEDLDLHTPYDVFPFNDDGSCDYFMPLPYYYQNTPEDIDFNFNEENLDFL